MKYCYYPGCKSDSRYPDRLSMRDVYFIPFPKPIKDHKKCLLWRELCGLKRKLVDIKSYVYICSKHFIGGNGPTKENPDPIHFNPTKENPEPIHFNPTKKNPDPIHFRSVIDSVDQTLVDECSCAQTIEKLQTDGSLRNLSQNSPSLVSNCAEISDPNFGTTVPNSSAIINDKVTEAVDLGRDAKESKQLSTEGLIIIVDNFNKIESPYSVQNTVEDSVPPSSNQESYPFSSLNLEIFPDGWSYTYFENLNQLWFTKQQSPEALPTISIQLNGDRTFIINVNGIAIPNDNPHLENLPSKLISEEELLETIKTLNNLNICLGSPEREFISQSSKMHVSGHFNARSCAMHSDYCLTFVDRGQRCTECIYFRQLLRMKNHRQKNRGKHHNYRQNTTSMNNIELREKLVAVKREMQRIKAQNAYLRKKIRKELRNDSLDLPEDDSKLNYEN